MGKVLTVVMCAVAAWSAAAGAVLDEVKASCRRRLGCGDARIREVVRFSEARALWSARSFSGVSGERAIARML